MRFSKWWQNFSICGWAISLLFTGMFSEVLTSLTLCKSKWKKPTGRKPLVISDLERSDLSWREFLGELDSLIMLACSQSEELTCIRIVPDGGYSLSEPVLSRASVRVSAHMFTRLERILLCFIRLLLASSNTFILCPKWEHFKDHSLQADSSSSSVISLRRVWVCLKI